MSKKNEAKIAQVLAENLGPYNVLNNGEYIFYCPRCGHHKPKLQVNIQDEVFHCWVCDYKGRTLLPLVKDKRDILPFVNNTKHSKEVVHEVEEHTIDLPGEIKYFKKPSTNIDYRNAIHYLFNRDIMLDLIWKYNIGYCDSGRYAGRIIIPSYNEEGKPNYFVARSFYGHEKKYLNPKLDKQIILFEQYISWNFPVVFVEGVFDAIKFDRNAIPILGNTISDYSIYKLIIHQHNMAYIALDEDANKFLYRNCKALMDVGIEPYIIPIPKGKDPGEMTKIELLELQSKAIPITKRELMKLKRLSSSRI